MKFRCLFAADAVWSTLAQGGTLWCGSKVSSEGARSAEVQAACAEVTRAEPSTGKLGTAVTAVRPPNPLGITALAPQREGGLQRRAGPGPHARADRFAWLRSGKAGAVTAACAAGTSGA